ncbi:hypothetical protein, partial [Streptomyces wedmorensis]
MTAPPDRSADGIRGVQDWILALNPDLTEVDTDADLFESGLIQSLQLVQLVLVIEDARGERLDRSTLRPDDLRSLSK